MGSSYKLWTKRLETETILTRGQIRQFCNAIAAGAYGFTIGGHRTNLSPEECALLMDQFHSRVEGYGLTPEHTQFGIQWLRDYPKRADQCGVSPELIAEFREFRFTDATIDRINDWGYRATILPVYRVIGESGRYVDYSWSPWQSKAYAWMG